MGRIDTRRSILEACDDLFNVSEGFIDDRVIAKVTGIQLVEVRKLLREMDEDRLVSLMKLEDGFKVAIEPGGQLYLFQRITRATRRQILRACVELSKDSGLYFEDVDIASQTRIRLKDVQVCLSCMEQDGYLEISIVPKGAKTVFMYTITAMGRIKNGIYSPFPDEIETTQSDTMVTSISQKLTSPKQPPSANSGSTAPSVPDRIIRTILFLGANPKDTVRLRLDDEVKKIEQGLERATMRDQFNLVQKWAVTDTDLRRGILDHKPEIVHFSGHGGGEDGLKFDDGKGKTHLITAKSLARLFALCSDHVKCVVLNACYAETQAEAIVWHIDYVIGMSKDIGDEASVLFSVGFYDALGAGKDIEVAFEFGRNAIDLRGNPEQETPVLLKRQKLELK